MRYQVGLIARWCEEDEVGKALDDHRRHLDNVCVAIRKALLHKLVDVTVQTVGHTSLRILARGGMTGDDRIS